MIDEARLKKIEDWYSNAQIANVITTVPELIAEIRTLQQNRALELDALRQVDDMPSETIMACGMVLAGCAAKANSETTTLDVKGLHDKKTGEPYGDYRVTVRKLDKAIALDLELGELHRQIDLPSNSNVCNECTANCGGVGDEVPCTVKIRKACEAQARAEVKNNTTTEDAE
jgi:hypothetical protein